MKRLNISSKVASAWEVHPSTAGSKVDCGTDWLGTGPATFAVWLKFVKRLGNSNVRLFDNGTTYMSFGGSTSSTATSNKIVFVSNGAADASSNPCSGDILNITNWNHYAVTRNASGVCNFYVNGVLSGTANQASGTPSAPTTNMLLGNNNAGSRGILSGLLSEAMTFNRVLNAQEINDLARRRKLPMDSDISLQSYHPLDDGRGATIARDLSKYGRTGTITSPISRMDVPTFKRKPVTPNLSRNGDFEITPPGGVPTTASGVWIDGTASGGTDINVSSQAYGWGVNKSGTVEAGFDTSTSFTGKASLKVSTKAIASFAEIRMIPTTPTIATLQQIAIKAKPNTSYSFSFYMKTNYVSGDSASGANLSVLEYNNAAGLIASNGGPTSVKTTTEWTQYTSTFTTQATTSFLTITAYVYGHTGTATLIMDAWFDNIVLTETGVTPTRQSLGSLRRKVRGNGNAMSFPAGSGANVQAPFTFPTDAYTVSFWYKKFTPTASTETIMRQVGSFVLQRQGTNDMQVYAYLNAPNDFAGLRRLRFRSFSFFGTKNSSSITNGFNQNWHHRAYVIYVSGGFAKCDEYEDGVKIGSTHSVDYSGDTATPSGNLFIGCNNGSVNQFDGSLSDVRIYNAQLTASQVANLFATGVDPVPPSGKWALNETSGSTAADSSGYNNNGTITSVTFVNDAPLKTRPIVS
jgi:hypothetical protein